MATADTSKGLAPKMTKYVKANNIKSSACVRGNLYRAALAMNDVSKTIDTSRQADIHIYLEKWNSADTPQ